MDKSCSTNGEKRNEYRLFIGGKARGKETTRKTGGWIILGWILERWDGMKWTG
jgi:hypothetical protein